MNGYQTKAANPPTGSAAFVYLEWFDSKGAMLRVSKTYRALGMPNSVMDLRHEKRIVV